MKQKPLLIWQPNIFPDEEREIAAKHFEIGENIPTAAIRPSYVFRGSTSTQLVDLTPYYMHKWVPYFADDMLSAYSFWQVANKVERHLLKADHFVKPDNSRKTFAGQVFNLADWKKELTVLKDKRLDDVLCFVAIPQKIVCEWRCLFVGMEFLGASAYMSGGKSIIDEPTAEYPQRVKDYACQLRKNPVLYPEQCVTIDVAMTYSDELRLVEINALETSGWYGIPPEPVYKALAEQLNNQ